MKKSFTLLLAVFSLLSFAQNALRFDGINDYVQTTFAGVTGSADRTFEAWIYLYSSPSSNMCILDYGLNAVGSRNTFMVNGSSNLAYIAGGTNTNISSTGAAITVGQWVHVAMVMDNGTGYFYVNGISQGSGSLSGVNTPTIGSNLRMGERVSGGSVPFTGKIDEVRVWNVARTQTQIQNSMNDEFCAIPTGLVAYYKFNNGVAGGSNTGLTTAIDEVAANNVTLTNFALTRASSNWVTGASLSSGSSTPGNATISSCGPYTSNTGHIWSTSGNYVDTLTSPTGCDSIVNVTLTVLANSSNTISATGCNKYTSPSGNFTWTTSGTYTDVLPSANGCDSVLTINLTINTVDTNILVNGITLTSWQTGSTYQWLDCNNGYAAISGATNQSYTATANGSYAVEITKNNCTDTSACYEVTNIGISEALLKNTLLIFPNPAHNEITINLGTIAKTLDIQLVDLTGKLIKTVSAKNASSAKLQLNLPAGLYFVKVSADGKSVLKKLTVY